MTRVPDPDHSATDAVALLFAVFCGIAVAAWLVLGR